ncbi:hypothetical protein AMATHDRAFT_41665 [Amanita thiersii Skay4041]|uniref:Uncharacterized protein n=1 Tax=Amanita thiersii Skay4041 TaxID=703135 RepID=A0A2A9NNP0_9AGAR|nr:hypothetical protein AMATHDRAFT_41665 [Amanita thiersii Skay4041]
MAWSASLIFLMFRHLCFLPLQKRRKRLRVHHLIGFTIPVPPIPPQIREIPTRGGEH